MKNYHEVVTRVPDFNLLRTLRIVALERNFTHAAKILNITQSAVSHQIRRLETDLGVKLFVRNAHQVAVTETGSELLKQILPVLAQLDQIFTHGLERQSSGSLEIELESAFNSDWLTPRLASFTKLRPDVRIELNISTQRRLEFRGATQLAIKWGKPAWPGYHVERLMGSKLTPMCCPTVLQECRLEHPIDLREHRLLHDRDETAWRMWAKVAGLKRLKVGGGHIFQDTLALKQAAIRGHGVAVYAKELAEKELSSGELIAPFPGLEVSNAGEYYIVTKRKKQSELMNDFISWLVGQVGLTEERSLRTVRESQS